MAEWSKAPDSRHMPYSYDRELQREFWSSYEGVGSNPTSDSNFLEIENSLGNSSRIKFPVKKVCQSLYL